MVPENARFAVAAGPGSIDSDMPAVPTHRQTRRDRGEPAPAGDRRYRARGADRSVDGAAAGAEAGTGG